MYMAVSETPTTVFQRLIMTMSTSEARTRMSVVSQNTVRMRHPLRKYWGGDVHTLYV